MTCWNTPYTPQLRVNFKMFHQVDLPSFSVCYSAIFKPFIAIKIIYFQFFGGLAFFTVEWLDYVLCHSMWIKPLLHIHGKQPHPLYKQIQTFFLPTCSWCPFPIGQTSARVIAGKFYPNCFASLNSQHYTHCSAWHERVHAEGVSLGELDHATPK